MSRGKGQKGKTFHIWSTEEKEYLSEIVTGRTYKEIQQLMNNKFDYRFSLEQIKGAISRYKLQTGTLGYFKKGHIPANKGKKQIEYMKPEMIERTKNTRFKKGHEPVNRREVGSERITKDGYIQVKVAEPNKWDLKHRIVYREHYGEIPENCNVVFGDGNKQNCNIDNLILVNKKEMYIMCTKGLFKDDTELTKTGKIIADLHLKIYERRK